MACMLLFSRLYTSHVTYLFVRFMDEKLIGRDLFT